MADWNSVQYLKFENERTQPAVDLANRILIDAPERIIDVGCGPGNSTHVLSLKFPDSYVLGIDNSPNMIENARQAFPELDFMICDACSGLSRIGSDFNIVFSNACIQWIPNHHKLLRDMMALLKTGGVLAVQVPMQYEQPIYKIIQEAASGEKWGSKLSEVSAFYNLTQSEYFDILSDIASGFSMWETTYYHRLKSHRDIIEWYRGSGLRPYLDILPEEERGLFEQDIYKKVTEQYQAQKNGDIIFRFPRLFFTAIK